MDKYSFYENLINFLSGPIMILNAFSGIVGGIWLLFLGDWQLVLAGLILCFTGHIGISILLLASLPFGMLASFLYEKGYKWGFYIFSFLSSTYTNLLMLATLAFALIICLHFHDERGKIAMIPYLLWSWGIGLGPWQFLASKELDNEFTIMSLFITSIFYLLLLITIFLGPILVIVTSIIFIIVELIIMPVMSIYLANKLYSQQI